MKTWWRKHWKSVLLTAGFVILLIIVDHPYGISFGRHEVLVTRLLAIAGIVWLIAYVWRVRSEGRPTCYMCGKRGRDVKQRARLTIGQTTGRIVQTTFNLCDKCNDVSWNKIKGQSVEPLDQ